MVKFFVAATGLAAVANADAGFDCSVNNGGCSHDCDAGANICECPASWALGDDGVTCQPAAGTVTTTCTSNTIKMSIAGSVLDGYEWASAHVGAHSDQDDSCMLSVSEQSPDVYVLEHGLEECGMTLEYVQDTETLVYSVSISF